MKRLLFLILSVYTLSGYSQCANCPSGTTAPGAAAAPSVKFHGYTSEVNKYDGVAPTCYTKTANTLNGHLQGINNALCDLQDLIDSLETVINTNDSTTIANIDSLQIEINNANDRLDSIVTALGQFYNTNIVSSDSSIDVTSTVVGEVIKFDLSVVNDSLELDSGNGLSGNGRAATPFKLGGTLTENTTLTGNKSLNNIVNAFTVRQTDSTNTNTLLDVRHFKKYNSISDFDFFYFGSYVEKKSIVAGGTYNLSAADARLFGSAFNHNLKLASSTILKKTGDTTAISFGDVCNLDVSFDAQETNGGNITSMRNLTLYPIYKGANVSPFSVYRYVSLALYDLNLGGVWATATDRYAIYQEGATDKNQFNGLMIMPNLTSYANDAAAAADTDLPSGGFYLITGSTAIHAKP